MVIMKVKLFSHNFILVVIGQVISLLGSAMLRFALSLYVLDTTGRADIFALVIAISVIPSIIFSPFGGAIADRFNRRNLMVIFDFSSSAIVFFLILLMNISKIPIAVIGVMLAILAIISSMYHPAVQASVPLLVSENNSQVQMVL
jgi:MFS family permease